MELDSLVSLCLKRSEWLGPVHIQNEHRVNVRSAQYLNRVCESEGYLSQCLCLGSDFLDFDQVKTARAGSGTNAVTSIFPQSHSFVLSCVLV